MLYNRLKLLLTLPKRFRKRESSFLERQQHHAFFYYTLAIAVGLLTNLLGVSGPQKEFNFWLNLFFAVVMVALCSCYIKRKPSLPATMFGIIMITEVSTCVEMIGCALTPDSFHLMLIVGNMVILMANIFFSLLVYFKFTPYILCSLNIIVYTACIVITKDESLANFALVFFAIFIAVGILSGRLVKNIHFLKNENTTLKQDEAELLEMLGHNKKEIKVFIELAKNSRQSNKTATLLNMLGEDMQRKVIASVKEHIMRTEAELLDMERLFPELSASEREVCLLILQDKKLADICNILNRSEGTVTSTRTHIRRKLGMQPSDNLKKVLQERAKQS